MVDVDDEIARLTAELARAPSNSPLEQSIAGDLFIAKNDFWAWAWWLGLDYWDSTRKAKDDVLAEVRNLRSVA